MQASVLAAMPKEAPTELISDVTYMTKGGVQGIKVDFTVPVHYVSHLPAKRGDTLTINLRFSRLEVPDVSQLPLLQSMIPPRTTAIPVTEVTYMTDKDRPQLVIKFSRNVAFSVSQVMGITSLVIFLPDSFKSKKSRKTEDVKMPSILPSEGQEQVKAAVGREEKLYRRGRRALQNGENRTAIQIFTALVGLDTHKYSKSSLELLGVARERNGQRAHAKSAYSDYLKKYKKDKDTARVKQRLAELLVSRQQPKKRLKNIKKDDKKRNNYRSDIYASFSQYLDMGQSKEELGDRKSSDVTQTSIDNQLSLNWRIRDTNYDVRNYFFGNYEYDTLNGETDGFEINSAYSKFKHTRAGVYFTVGRQAASSTGVLSRFDGLLLGYDLTKRIRLNLIGGFPVISSQKTTIQTDSPFRAVNLELNGFWKAWDVSPYYYKQDIDGYENREAIGAEVRYFHNRGDLFAQYDRDIMFNATNIILVRGKILVHRRTALKFNYDKRRSPSLETSRILVGADLLPGVDRSTDTVKDIIDKAGLTKDQVLDFANALTGESKLITIGISHSFSNALTLTIDRSSSNYTSKSVDTQSIVPSISVDESKLNDLIVQIVTSQSFYLRDSTIVSFRASRGSKSLDNSLSFEYRWPFSNNLRITARLQVREREQYDDTSASGIRQTTATDRILPSTKIDYRIRRNMRFYGELTYEHSRFDTGSENTSGKQELTTLYMGYTWDIL
ncbi:MAG: hypothetical protein ACC707_02070 [Thiohalomonadales bacterium]